MCEENGSNYQKHELVNEKAYGKTSKNLFEEQKNDQASRTKTNLSASKISIPLPPKGTVQVIS